MTFKPVYTFSFLSLAFLAFSFSIYLNPALTETAISIEKQQAAAGRLVWQKYNCQACHQLYGLGGYLGPDLTNTISHPKKGEVLIRAMIKSGTKQMPVYNLPENELRALIAFLKMTDASGRADPRSFSNTDLGMIEQK